MRIELADSKYTDKREHERQLSKRKCCHTAPFGTLEGHGRTIYAALSSVKNAFAAFEELGFLSSSKAAITWNLLRQPRRTFHSITS